MKKDRINNGLAVDVATNARIVELSDAYRAMFEGVKEIDAALREYHAQLAAYQALVVDGQTIQEQREVFRKRVAAIIQGARTRDVAFKGYLGMNPYANGGTGIPGARTHGSPDALAATPYVYLIPAVADSMRTPPLNVAAVTVRSWNVLDHAMPLPFDLGGSGLGQNTSWTGATSLSEPFFLPRKHQPFRAVADPTLFYSTVPAEFTNRRLIGRSVWNPNWKLVIPAQTLLADPRDGIERFIRSVKDIKLFVRTYSASGN